MKEFGRRALALVLAVLLLGLCACSAKTEMVQEETAASEIAAEPAQDAVKPEEAPVAEEPTKDEAADAAIDEQPETVEPEGLAIGNGCHSSRSIAADSRKGTQLPMIIRDHTMILFHDLPCCLTHIADTIIISKPFP